METLGVNLRRKDMELGLKEKARRNECDVRFSLVNKSGLPEMLREEIVEDGFCSRKSVKVSRLADGERQQTARWKHICAQTWSVTAGNSFHVIRDMWKQLWSSGTSFRAGRGRVAGMCCL